ncbi:MAG: hypothetical protein D6748_08060 [Calditrichaeota bacterium]|nr:MAG: hypothetical protein D6748_08060 [Calditrichota bacterium]
MLRKLKRDLSRGELIYPVAEEVHSPELREYYFIMEEKALKAGISQNFHFDEEGIPIIPTYIDVEERRMIYYPISIGQYGLSIFHTYLETGDEADRERFLKIVQWFYQNAQQDEKRGCFWLTDVPKPEFKIYSPWPSAFSQSRGISILLRGYQLTGEKAYLSMAGEALKIFQIPAAKGGVTTFTDVGPIYEEYPAPFLTAVLDGTIFSLFGLYDYVRAGEDTSLARKLFDEGISALKAILPRYDLGYWIRYNLCDQPFYPKIDPATITYFRLVNSQLRILHRITNEPFFLEIADRWKNYDHLFNILRMYLVKYIALRKLNRI